MVSKEEFKSIVETVVIDRGKTQEELALEMGYGRNYISEMTSPTGKVSDKFVKAFKLRYKDSLENPNNSFHVKKDGISDLTAQTIYNLSESNMKLADANQSLARSHEELVKMAKNNSNSTAPGQNNITEPPIPAVLLEALAVLGSGKQWRSKEEALRELGMILNLHKPGTRSKESILSGGHK